MKKKIISVFHRGRAAPLPPTSLRLDLIKKMYIPMKNKTHTTYQTKRKSIVVLSLTPNSNSPNEAKPTTDTKKLEII